MTILETQTTTNITTPNDLDILKTHFSHYFDKNGKFDLTKFQKELESKEVEISKESYGLDWLGKSYARVLRDEPALTLLKENKEWNNKEQNQNSENLLIKGDNLEVLKHLSNAYYEKIKMIYIDPPYNTGSDGFVYQDDRKFELKEFMELAGIGDEERAKKILSFTKAKSNSHSAWLTFMYPRLYIARQLLKDDGVIFVSIDDNEVAQLRLVMDEIFGEENFVEQLIWKKRATPPNDRSIGRIHEHILCYSKNTNLLSLNLIPRNEKSIERYSNPDNDPRGNWVASDLSANGKGGRLVKSCIYPITNPLTGEEFMPSEGRCWLFNKEKMDTFLLEGRVSFRQNTGAPFLKRYLSEVRDGLTLPTILDNLGYSSSSAIEADALFVQKGIFEYAKPTLLIKTLITISSSSNDLILDFFAGSGTTGDAVMQLNSEDGGNRKFILVQLDEPIDEKKNKTAFDFVKGLGSPLTPLEKGEAEGRGINYDIDSLKQRGLITNGNCLPYNPDNIKKAQELRKNMTLAEKKLWYEVLQNKKLKELKFLRQKPIDHYIVDFYCAKFRLAIEIDGSSHDNKQEYDNQRTELLNLYGVKVVRYTNDEVLNNIDGVYQDLLKYIESPLTPLEKGESEGRGINSLINGEAEGRGINSLINGEAEGRGINFEPTIFEITKERLIRAAKKIQLQQKEKNDKKASQLEFEEKQQNSDFGFKIFETQPIWDDYEFIAKEMEQEGQELFDESKLAEEDLQTLLTTWQAKDRILLTENLAKIDLDSYFGYYHHFKQKLYLMDKGFETKNLVKLIGEIDENPSFNPKTVICFGHNWTTSMKIRETFEGLKNYGNKKSLDIDLEIRY